MRNILFGNTWRAGVLLGAALAVAATPAAAVPVIFDEAVGGDLDGSQSFSFDVGVNSVSGSQTFFINPENIDIDEFLFSIPNGEFLLSVVYNVTDFDLTGVATGGFANPGILDLSTGTIIGEIFDLTAPLSVDLFADNLPLTGSNFLFITGMVLTGDPTQPAGMTFDYTVAFTVESVIAVAEPSSMALFLVGLVLIAGVFLAGRRQII